MAGSSVQGWGGGGGELPLLELLPRHRPRPREVKPAGAGAFPPKPSRECQCSTLQPPRALGPQQPNIVSPEKAGWGGLHGTCEAELKRSAFWREQAQPSAGLPPPRFCVEKSG